MIRAATSLLLACIVGLAVASGLWALIQTRHDLRPVNGPHVAIVLAGAHDVPSGPPPDTQARASDFDFTDADPEIAALRELAKIVCANGGRSPCGPLCKEDSYCVPFEGGFALIGECIPDLSRITAAMWQSEFPK